MHIPDGFLSTPVCLSAWAGTVLGLGFCFRKAQRSLQDKTIPLMGVMAAFIFAAQMFNFPVMGGTSGHLLGGVLAAVVLGPYAAAIIMAAVLTVQSFVFQDGGIVALGANILNIALVGSLSGYIAYSVLRSIFKQRILVPVAFASWLSVITASVCCAVELSLSGTAVVTNLLIAMTSIHSLIGIGEAIITTLVVRFVMRTRPDVLYRMNIPYPHTITLGLVCIGLILLLLPLSSSWPDGLEYIAHSFGIFTQGKVFLFAPLPDYHFPGIKNEQVATLLAGGAGTLLLIALAYGIYLVKAKREIT